MAALASQNGQHSTTVRASVGTSGLKRWRSNDGFQIQEEFLRELQGIRGIKIFNEMRKNDPIIGGLLRATTDIIRGVKWSTNPTTGRASKFLGECIQDTAHSWSDFISDATSMCAFGWAWFEITYKQRNGFNPPESTDYSSNYNDGRIGWHKIALRAQDSLVGWDLDEAGNVQGMNQRGAPNFELKTIPISKSVLFRTSHERNNPEGDSFLRTSYTSWYMKRNLQEIEGIGIERDLTGLMVITLPKSATSTDVAAANEILTKVKADEQAGITFQKGEEEREDWNFELLASPGAKQIDIDKAINRYATEIAIALLGQFIRLALAGTTGARGSSSLGATGKEFFYVSLSALVDNMEDTMNMFMVPPLMRMNGFSPPWPKLKHGRIAPRDMAIFINALERLADSGLLGDLDDTLLTFIRDETEMPLPENSLEKPRPLGQSGAKPKIAPDERAANPVDSEAD